jgi:fructose-specific phosphotransferase system component IIB
LVQNLKALSDFSATTISIKTLGNVSVENLICENVIVRADEIHFFAANEIKESFYFINNVGLDERKFYTQ